MLNLARLPVEGARWRTGVLSLAALLACACADARTAGLGGASTSFAVLTIIAALLSVSGGSMSEASGVWGYPALALLVASGWLAWRVRSRLIAFALPRWHRVDAALATRCDAPAAHGWHSQRVLAAVNPHFVRMQAAWDVADLATLQALTTPSMFEEIVGQLGARGQSPNRTDVLTVEVELLRVEQVGSMLLASVQFSGVLREASEGGAVPFRELWMLTHALDDAADAAGGAWRLARQQALW
ncbi:MAG: Tim44-like domain-containing protein [Burkholderiaceae bacterium]